MSESNKGGIFKGKSHAEGGIPLVVPETGQQLEVESNEPLIPDSLRQEQEFAVPIIHAPDVPILRWCHSELAIVPTKKSLRVLFFEN